MYTDAILSSSERGREDTTSLASPSKRHKSSEEEEEDTFFSCIIFKGRINPPKRKRGYIFPASSSKEKGCSVSVANYNRMMHLKRVLG
jgi:hypothetical protein